MSQVSKMKRDEEVNFYIQGKHKNRNRIKIAIFTRDTFSTL